MSAVYTTFHPGVRPYFRDFMEALDQQTESGFTLYVGLDRCDEQEVHDCAERRVDAVFVNNVPGGSMADMRNAGLFKALEDGHEAVVLIDADDVPGPDRVKNALAGLERHDAVACAMVIVDGELQPVAQKFVPSWQEGMLIRENVFGFSNSAYRSEILKKCLPVPTECILVDWYLATSVWLAGGRMNCLQSKDLFYRQYGNNLAQVVPPFSPESVIKAARTVLGHYDILLSNPPAGMGPFQEDIQQAASDVKTFIACLEADSKRLAEYAQVLSDSEQPNAWWTGVANPEWEEIWNC